MTERRWFVGIDWGHRSHQVRISDETGANRGEHAFDHGGAGLAEMVAWLIAKTGAEPADIHVAIEVPHGPVVETLLERGFNVYAINPKQLDRFRDRFSLAGAKDDSRDAEVMASALRTDPHCLRRIEPSDAAVIELRECSRLADDLSEERVRLTNRLREQLWRYFPAMIEIGCDLDAEWFLELWTTAPTPAKAAKLRHKDLASLLERHRIRRFDPAKVLATLRQPPLHVLPGTEQAARAHIATLVARIRLLNRQSRDALKRIDHLIERLTQDTESKPGQIGEQHDATILASVPGVGRIVLATLLAEAPDPLRRRDYHAMRCLTGAAPVTKQSGDSHFVVRRFARHPRLANALYHWARVATQRDPISKAKYAALRARGHSHGRALRSVGDRLLNVACAMLRDGTLFQPAPQALK